MVSSKINPKVNYDENKNIDNEDIGYETSIYILDVKDMDIAVVLGKPKYRYSDKNLVYYPIYVVADNTIKSQIGVYESEMTKALNLLDADGDIDIDRLDEPLIYSFVTKKYLQKSNTNPKIYLDEDDRKSVTPKAEEEKMGELEIVEKESDEIKVIKEARAEVEAEEDDDDDADVMKLKVKASKVSAEKRDADKTLEKGVFEIDTKHKMPELLKEETEEDANKLKIGYKESSRNLWIEKFMKNDQYGIIDNEGRGDCFFAVIRDAFEHIGHNTTVQKLRALLATHVTVDIFEELRRLYMDFEAQIDNLTADLKSMKKTNDVYARRIKKITGKEEKETIVEEAKKLKAAYSEKAEELKDTKKLQENYIGYMKNIDTFEKYREYIKTSSYWADAWAISTLEALLNIKVIIFSEEAYKTKANDNVLNCGEISTIIQQKSHAKDFNPSYYIMTTYSGSHYRLVTYKNKHILTFQEIPYDVKILIVNKCLERNSGIYHLIPDFRNFKSQLGLDPDEGKPSGDEEEIYDGGIYTNTAIFLFYPKSMSSAKPGKGSGESIVAERQIEFTPLSKIPDWRRKLDDDWAESPFMVDGHRWASVQHYLQGAQFKKGFPDFYKSFSMDTPSDLSRDIDLAKYVGNISKTKYKDMRPNGVKVDIDYDLGRSIEERKVALLAKFSQNEDLKQMLLATKDAHLKQLIRRHPAHSDRPLMTLRMELANAEAN
jgi:hypothetical protein